MIMHSYHLLTFQLVLSLTTRQFLMSSRTNASSDGGGIVAAAVPAVDHRLLLLEEHHDDEDENAQTDVHSLKQLKSLSSSRSSNDNTVITLVPVLDMDANDYTASAGDQKLIPDEITWRFLYQAYRRSLYQQQSGDGKNENTANDDDSFHLGGFVVPYEVQSVPGKGRGVFNSGSLIQKGDLVLECFTAEFHEQDQWRTFLAQLPLSLARDVVSWAYIFDDRTHIGDPLKHVVMLDLQAGSLINHGDSSTTCHDEISCTSSSFSSATTMSLTTMTKAANLIDSDDEETLSPGFHAVHASRDIAPGEEFLMDYRLFHVQNHTLKWFDEIRQQLVSEEFGFDILSLNTAAAAAGAAATTTNYNRDATAADDIGEEEE